MNIKRRLFDFKSQILNKRNKPLIKSIKDGFNKKENFIRIEYTWLVPDSSYFTKDGTMAERIGDWSNLPKYLDDVIFNDVLNIDDSQAKKGIVNIIPWPKKTYVMMIDISLGNISDIKEVWKTLEANCDLLRLFK